jgi:DNA-directed RNA polymerase subunit RPC12/RpoP
MAPFLYRCPNTGQKMQGWVADDRSDGEDDTHYEEIACIACGLLHLVNPKTGKVLGPEDDWG